ncbi:MAG: ABC transporter ATP-binding protein, partial [Actinobacteria bacterium]|nr:ABC transporter ATP-binding protein [Actinomycetota bacterium]
MTKATGMNDPGVIETRGLTKRYGGRTVVDSLDISVPTGVIAGFVGPNGAGKTTTLRMLLGLVRPTDGQGHVLGVPLTEPSGYLARVGALIESPAFYPGLSGERNLAVQTTLSGIEPGRIPVVLDRVGLAHRGADPYRTYSLGMKQRLGIAAALLGEPSLLILDEPTNGLDPAGIREMRELLRSLASYGRTIFVSSHLLAEVEQVCDWLVVIEAGALRRRPHDCRRRGCVGGHEREDGGQQGEAEHGPAGAE